MQIAHPLLPDSDQRAGIDAKCQTQTWQWPLWDGDASTGDAWSFGLDEAVNGRSRI